MDVPHDLYIKGTLSEQSTQCACAQHVASQDGEG